MWLKYIAIVVAFYIVAIMQGSFFAHFQLCAGSLSLFFILFFTLLFFEKSKSFLPVLIYAIVGGFIIDASMNYYFGTAILGLLITGFFIKKTKQSLHNSEKENPLSYFIVMFVFALLFYNIIIVAISTLLDKESLYFVFKTPFIKPIICNTIIAIIFYFVYKKATTKK